MAFGAQYKNAMLTFLSLLTYLAYLVALALALVFALKMLASKPRTHFWSELAHHYLAIAGSGLAGSNYDDINNRQEASAAVTWS